MRVCETEYQTELHAHACTWHKNHGISSEFAEALGHHHLNEFLVVDFSIHIRFSNHFIDFFVGQFSPRFVITCLNSAAEMKQRGPRQNRLKW